MSGGLRILTLDGGGTRTLSTLVALKEIMDVIVPGQGGKVRPSEYFDIIGAAGPNALAALLFVKFTFSIDEALEYCYEFSSRMEKAEEVFLAKHGEDLDGNDWKELEQESPEADGQMEMVRRQVLSNTWSELISREITDWLERSDHKENGKFNFKSPEAYVGVGRCRAAVMGSEAPGYGPDGGVTKDRIYHAPRWHRSYHGRHTTSQYTLYAIALGTCASPGIIGNGLVFPDLAAPGTHIVHNPVELLLEECGKIWPGLHANLILSIGTGKLALPEQWDFESHPHGFTSATACLKISEEASRIAEDIEKYVVPHHKMYQNAYFRFNVSSALPLFENEGKDDILSKTTEYFQDRVIATRAARVADLLGEDGFPDTWEDHIAISSLAFLLTVFASTGHNTEAEMISDALSTFVLYEPTRVDSGTHRKLSMAVRANELIDEIRRQDPLTDLDLHRRSTSQNYAADHFLNTLMAYGEFGGLPAERYHGDEFNQLSSVSDIAAAVYYILTVARSESSSGLKSPLFATVIRQVTPHLSMPAEITSALTSRLEELLTISSISSICEASYREYLTAEPRLLLNGSFIRHLTNTVLQIDLHGISLRLLEPIANAIAAIIHLGKWSSIRDSLVVRLLEVQPQQKTENWAFINLAVEWKAQAANDQQSEPSIETSKCDNICQKLMEDFKEAFNIQKSDVAQRSVTQGYLGLLRKALEGDELHTKPRVGVLRPCNPASSLLQLAVTDQDENLLHLGVKSAFIPAMKMMLEALGTVQSKKYLAEKDEAAFCPLHIACKRRGDMRVLLLCMYGGASPDAVGPEGRTALHFCFPQKGEIHDYVTVVEDFAQDHGLLLTLPLKRPRAWGIHGKGKEIGNDTFLLRRIISQLYGRGASINIADRWGATPAHLAAANGWGINVDVIFSRVESEAEQMARECLLSRDKQGNSVLSLMRDMGDEEGETIILAEMRKRCMDISAPSQSQSKLSTSVYGTEGRKKLITTTREASKSDVPARPDLSYSIPKETNLQLRVRQINNSNSIVNPLSVNRKPLTSQLPSEGERPSSQPRSGSTPQQHTTDATGGQLPPTASSIVSRVPPPAASPIHSQPTQYSPSQVSKRPEYRPPGQYSIEGGSYQPPQLPKKPEVPKRPEYSPPDQYSVPDHYHLPPQAPRLAPQPSNSRPLSRENALGGRPGSKLLRKIFK